MKRIVLFTLLCSILLNSGCITLPKIGPGEGAVMAGLVLLKYIDEHKNTQPAKNNAENKDEIKQETPVSSCEIDKTILNSIHSYQNFDYNKTINSLESLPKDKANNQQLLLIYQYLAVSYYLTGNKKAEEYFAQILSIDKNFEFDSSFPSHLIDYFNQLKSRRL